MKKNVKLTPLITLGGMMKMNVKLTPLICPTPLFVTATDSNNRGAFMLGGRGTAAKPCGNHQRSSGERRNDTSVEERGMRIHHRWLKLITKLGFFLMMGISMTAEAGLFGVGGVSWKEEVLLHDGSEVVVERWVKRGGRHEIGQLPPYKEQSLSFTLSDTGQTVKWEDRHSEDIGTANFLPMALEIVSNIPYFVVTPMGCLSYNKWGRPNPPYVIFKYVADQWIRISLQELPAEIQTPNLIVSAPDLEVEKIGKNPVPASEINRLVSRYRSPEMRSILRELLAPRTDSGLVGCEELVYYMGAWVGPGDSIGKRMMDRSKK